MCRGRGYARHCLYTSKHLSVVGGDLHRLFFLGFRDAQVESEDVIRPDTHIYIDEVCKTMQGQSCPCNDGQRQRQLTYH